MPKVTRVTSSRKDLLFVLPWPVREGSSALLVFKAMKALNMQVMEVVNPVRQIDEMLEYGRVILVVDGHLTSLWESRPAQTMPWLPDWAKQVSNSCAIIGPMVVHHESLAYEVARKVYWTSLRDLKKAQTSVGAMRRIKKGWSVENPGMVRFHSASFAPRHPVRR